MITIFKNVIKRGGYDLTKLLKQIDTYHIEGKLTDDERTELHLLARQDVKAQYDYSQEIEKLWVAIREIRTLVDSIQANLDNDTTSGGDSSAVETPVLDFVQPQGAYDAYQVGDKVIYNGFIYQCTIVNCVWAPDVLPSAWTLLEVAEA